MIGVFKSTVAMWEIGERESELETLCALLELFDRRIDYILGCSDHAATVKMSEDGYEGFDCSEVADSFYETIIACLQQDEYGKRMAADLIKNELGCC